MMLFLTPGKLYQLKPKHAWFWGLGIYPKSNHPFKNEFVPQIKTLWKTYPKDNFFDLEQKILMFTGLQKKNMLRTIDHANKNGKNSKIGYMFLCDDKKCWFLEPLLEDFQKNWIELL